MTSVIPEDKWRRSGQWIGLIKKHAEIIVRDQAISAAFERHCERKASEHYMAVVLAAHDLEDETICATSSVSTSYRSWTGKYLPS